MSSLKGTTADRVQDRLHPPPQSSERHRLRYTPFWNDHIRISVRDPHHGFSVGGNSFQSHGMPFYAVQDRGNAAPFYPARSRGNTRGGGCMGRENWRPSELAVVLKLVSYAHSPLEVLEVPSYGYESHVTFLDEFRIMVSRYDNTADTSDLVVFDTRIPQSRPDVFQRFGLPSRYHTDRVRVRVDCNRPMGMTIREEPFTADPAQAVFVLELSLSGELDSCVLLVVRISALVGRTGSYIRWEEWAGGFVIAEIPLVRNTVTTFVHGAYAAVAVIRDREYCRLHTFDFSKRGCHALPLWGGESGASGRRFALKNDGRDVLLEGIRPAGRVLWPEAMGLLGDGVVVYLDSVSHPPRFSKDGVVG